jgi:hypothetical protein
MRDAVEAGATVKAIRSSRNARAAGSRRSTSAGKKQPPAIADAHVTRALAHLRPFDGGSDIDRSAARQAAGDLLAALGWLAQEFLSLTRASRG